MRFVLHSLQTHEIPLAGQLIAWIDAGEVAQFDRGFCCWGLIALLQR